MSAAPATGEGTGRLGGYDYVSCPVHGVTIETSNWLRNAYFDTMGVGFIRHVINGIITYLGRWQEDGPTVVGF